MKRKKETVKKAMEERCVLPRIHEWKVKGQAPTAGGEESAGYDIPLHKLWHSFEMLTRGISRRDLQAKVEMFRKGGGCPDFVTSADLRPGMRSWASEVTSTWT